ncbi:MAG: cupin domain-containing protein [Pseudomonadota bacterium]
MSSTRIFASELCMHATDGEPIRSIVTESPDATVVAWNVLPGQRIACHIHPHGQDTWTILSGRGAYQIDAGSESRTIVADDVVVAHRGQVHGVRTLGAEPLCFISVVTPSEAGYALV